MDYLEKIFGGAPRVKLMRLFLFNETTAFLKNSRVRHRQDGTQYDAHVLGC